MAYAPSPRFWVTLFRTLLNTFIHSAGDDPLLAQAHAIWQHEPTHSDNVLLMVPIVVGVILSGLIRYILGHVLMSILILESVKNQASGYISEMSDKKPGPSSRQLLHTIATIYRKGNFRLLLNGIGSASSYWVKHMCTKQMLMKALFLPGPVAYIVSSVLLAEYHFLWTARTILPRDQQRFVPNSGDRQRWKALVPATALYAVAESFMMHVPAMFGSDLGPSPSTEVSKAYLSGIVGSDIFVSGAMLAAQLLLFFPSFIALILVQTSLLPSVCETLVSAPVNRVRQQQQRGSRVGEIFAAFNKGPLHVQDMTRIIGARHMLWCVELHAKMCLSLVGVSAVVHLAVYNMK
ncbi:uncharacterized protein BO88DRAFT_396134 [Aspergillus vadensis CBS 113365]|uniref:Uncharacterized protein n=1 Tax=Aspergillus vadensis (strain CBS 113365 / IMI 142717 / IBT 24658) TaxID=1448311 RepID=A0A319C8F1_ASPVC|nr:hypothetical protein BO88DRAFT_396134 [Aspergillus vadensis CBS 113365]PYH65012.1 hypothetical protein BO88DRAFT_396134 [Aspergillus vadensis CBS 113365]